MFLKVKRNAIKKYLKIFAWIVGIFTLVLFSLAIAAQSARVQTMIAQKAMNIIGQKIDGDIHFDRINISPSQGISIKNVFLVDKNPYQPEDGVAQDTLFRADYVTATFSLKNLISKNKVSISHARVINGLFVLTSEPAPDGVGKGSTNISRVFKSNPNKEKKEKKNNKSINISRIDVEGMEFRMKNYRPRKRPYIKRNDVIDWKDLEISDIHLKAKNMKVAEGVVSGNVNALSFKEKSGFNAKDITGKVEVGNGKTLIENLYILDDMSEISMTTFSMSYKDSKAFKDFLNNVRLDAEIEPSVVDFQTIAYFARALKKMDFCAEIEGTYGGPVSDFQLDKLHFKNVENNMFGTIDGRLSGIPASQKMALNATLTNTEFNLAELESFIQSFAPSASIGMSKFANGERFNLEAKVTGLLNNMTAHAVANSGIGSLNADVNIRNIMNKSRAIQIGGNISTDRLNIGEVLDNAEFGECTMMTQADIALEKGYPQINIDTLVVDKLYAHGHEYTNISAGGYYSKQDLHATLTSTDPELLMSLQAEHVKADNVEDGYFQIYADVRRANLDALNLYKHGTSTLSFNADGFINETTRGGINGDIQFNDLILQDVNGLHNIGNLLITAKLEDNENTIAINSSVLDGSFSGSGRPSQFFKDYINISLKREIPSLFKKVGEDWSGNHYNVNLRINDSHDLLSFFIPGLYVEENTSIRMGIDNDGQAYGRIRSERLALKDKYLKGVRFDLDNRERNLNLVINADEISFSPIFTKQNRLMLLAHEDTFGIGLSYNNETELDNKGEIFVRGKVDREQADSLGMNMEIIPSNLYLNSSAWSIKPSNISVRSGRISVDSLVLSHDNQKIQIDGGYSKQHSDSLDLTLEQFDISSLQPLVSNKIQFSGLATGHATIRSSESEGLGLLMNLSVDSTYIAEKPAGTILIGSSWNEEEDGFDFTIRNSLSGKSSIVADVLLQTKEKKIDGDLNLDQFRIGYLEPLLHGVFSEMDGKLSGTINLSGPLNEIDIESRGLMLDDAKMRVDFTNVAYNVSGPIHLDNSGAWFDSNVIEDEYGETGTISGGIAWDRFKNMNFQTNINFNNLEVINLEENANKPFYGNIFATGRLNIAGPMRNLMLNVNASTSKEGTFHVPMSSYANAGASDILTFKEEYVEVPVDRYEEMMGRYEIEEQAKNDLGVSLRINVNPQTEAFIEIDKASGNILTGRGNGNIEVDVRPSRDIFNINGNYDLNNGNYHLDVIGIAQKDFAIQEGSTIRFSGDIMDSELDINAIYRTKAVVGTLIADTTSTARRNVECGIAISDKIRNPRISFSINVPDLDPTTQAMVENALNTEDKVQKQFLSLLLSSSFLPDETSGIVNNTNMLNTTMSEIMAGQLNNILQKLDIPVDLGLDFQSGNNGKSIYDVAISTELFNNRVIVNGTIGNRLYGSSATNNNEVVGDLDIEIKIDKSGALRFNIFSHSADQYTSYLDDSQRNGLGLTYQREFNSLREFFGDIFKSKKKRKAAEAERQQALLNAERTIIEIEE